MKRAYFQRANKYEPNTPTQQKNQKKGGHKRQVALPAYMHLISDLIEAAQLAVDVGEVVVVEPAAGPKRLAGFSEVLEVVGGTVRLGAALLGAPAELGGVVLAAGHGLLEGGLHKRVHARLTAHSHPARPQGRKREGRKR